MQRQRVLIVFGIAWLSALALSWWVFQRGTAPQTTPDLVSVVAAAKDLPAGKRILAADLKLISLSRKDLPKNVFLKAADVVDRAVSATLTANEVVVEGRLAAKGTGEGLAALIEPGTRAISVQVNEISGVSGFIQPGTRVDVLFTRTFTNGDMATTTILQNVKVIAYGRQLDAVRPNPTDNTRATVATLLVSQEQGERLVLAEQRGRIQLALRSSLDDEMIDSFQPVKSADLGIPEPEKPKPVVAPPPIPPAVAAAAAAAAKKKEEDTRKVVKVYRGDKVTEERFP